MLKRYDSYVACGPSSGILHIKPDLSTVIHFILIVLILVSLIKIWKGTTSKAAHILPLLYGGAFGIDIALVLTHSHRCI